jgi:hypothetical protein
LPVIRVAGRALAVGLVAGAALFVSASPASAAESSPRRDHGLIQRAAQLRQLAQEQQAAVRERGAAEAALAAALQARSGVNWDGIARCETNGNWHMRGARFSGGLGFANTTWRAFGGTQFASNAGLATRDQQVIVAERVHDRYGLSGWGCRRAG